MSRLKQLKNHINNMIKQTQLECIECYRQSARPRVNELHGMIQAYYEMLDVIDNLSNNQHISMSKQPTTIRDLNLSEYTLINLCKALHLKVHPTKKLLQHELELYRIENEFKIGIIHSFSDSINSRPPRKVLFSPFVQNPEKLECIDIFTGQLFECSIGDLVTCQK